MERRKILKRRFLGVLDPRVDDEKGRDWVNFQHKHLRAYLRGWSFFYHGRDESGRPALHKVQQEYYEI